MRKAGLVGMVPSAMARDERDSLLDDDDLAPSLLSRVGLGCGLGCVVVVLLIGALGLLAGAHRRLADWGSADDETTEGPPDVAPEPDRPEPLAGPDPGPDPVVAARSTMRERYRPGPYVNIESMVESGRLLPVIGSSGAPAQRTIDTPWLVPGAELRPGPMPAASPGGPSVSHESREPHTQPLTVLVRTPTRALVRARDASGGTRISGYFVDFVGYSGHFWLPATVPTELGVVSAGGSEGATVYFAIQSPVMANGISLQPGQSFPATMRIAAVDAERRASPPIERRLDVMSVGAGDVEVTLTMGEATDMDLYVTDPSGVLVYFRNTSAFSGGHLDLDANAACSSNMGRNNEHIYWPAGRAPVGAYQVHVAHYESCIQGRPVSFRVTIAVCGETVVLAGSFDGRSNPRACHSPGADTRGWCQEVVRFAMPGCAPAAP